MGIMRVVVEDESGKQVGDAVDFSSDLVSGFGDPRSICLRFVDPYGDTIFNRLQIPAVLEDLDLVSGRLADPVSQDALKRIGNLALTCQSEPHLYLRFIGD